jgi:hypothetical protein
MAPGIRKLPSASIICTSEDLGLIFSAISFMNLSSIKRSPSKIDPSFTILAFLIKILFINSFL